MYRYTIHMIASFGNKWLGRLWQWNDRLGLSPDAVPRISRILALLNGAESVDDLAVPGFRFHALEGSEPPRYGMRVAANTRLTFAWHEGAAEAVDLEDRHLEDGHGD